MKRLFVGAAAACAALMAVLPQAIAQTVELKLSHYLPPVHGIHTDFVAPWAQELERRTNGKVKVTVFPGTNVLGNVAKQYDQVVAGVTDIAVGLQGIPRGRFPRTSVIEMPFLTESAGAASMALWEAYPKHLKDEYKGVKVLALFAHNGGLIHTRDKPVKTADDLKGLRIRTPSPAANAMLEYLGATPVGLPPAEIYEALQKGTIDGTLFPWDPVKSFNLAEVLKHHLDARAYTTPFYFVMNQRKYDGLPDDVKKAIDETTGAPLVAKFGGWWNAWDKPGLEAATARGNSIATLSPEERRRWIAALEPMTRNYLAKLEKDGVANAQAIYEDMKALVAKHETK